MRSKINEYIKKAFSYLAAFIGGALSLLLYFRFSSRYKDVRKQLKSATESADRAIARLDDVERQRGKISESNQTIRESIEHERRSLDEIGRSLKDNATVLDRSEKRIAECQRILDQCKAELK